MPEIKNSVKKVATRVGVFKKKQVVLNRVRAGHTKLTHGYLMDSDIPDVLPVCSKGHNTKMTEKLIFAQCEAMQEERRKILHCPMSRLQ